MSTDTKPIDIHTHLLNYEITPPVVYYDGREIPLKTLSPLIHAYCDSDPIDDVIEWFYNCFTEKDIDSDPIGKAFFTPLNEQVKLFKALPVRPNIMTIDFREDDATTGGIKYALANRYAAKIAKETGGFFTQGLNPGCSLVFDLDNGSALKAYPAMWTSDTAKGMERLAWMSAEFNLPIITHANQGGIGQNKANSRPEMWWDALAKCDNAVICLAHAIGYSDSDWATVELMNQEFRFPNGDPRVYVDTAFCDGAKFDTAHYFNLLRDRLSGPLADSILFGSDYPLHLVYYSIEELVALHVQHLGPELWHIISQINPSRFFGVTS